jgi:hypothetical protein
MFVKPAPGLLVRDPVTKRHLPESGKEVPENSYWVRRLAAGDVVLSAVDVLEVSQIPDSKGKE